MELHGFVAVLLVMALGSVCAFAKAPVTHRKKRIESGDMTSGSEKSNLDSSKKKVETTSKSKSE